MEVVISVVIASILTLTLAILVATQSRFFLRADDEAMAARSVRALFDGMGTDLRGIETGGIISAAGDAVSVRTEEWSAVVCGPAPGGGADLFIYHRVQGPNLQPGWRGVAFSELNVDSVVHRDGFQPRVQTSTQARNRCRATGADPGRVEPRRSFQLATGWSQEVGGTPQRGTVVRLYGRVTYSIRVAASDSTESSIHRNGQEFVTPIASGAAFGYRLADGSVRDSVAAADLDQIRSVRLTGTALGANGRSPGLPFTYETALRGR